MDPLADKLLVTSALDVHGSDGRRSRMDGHRDPGQRSLPSQVSVCQPPASIVIAAAMVGKIKTVTQIDAIIFLHLGQLAYELISVPFAQIMALDRCDHDGFIPVGEYIYKSKGTFSRSR